MTKSELIAHMCEVAPEGMTKKATESFVDELFSALATAIKNDGRFTFPGFGTFSVRERKEREGRNPQTGETMTIKASRTVAFKPASAFKDELSPN